eukprot:GFYU01001130.1.p3 GENE.GFYU01001130.1~~GFYU01001130.1.p3  ORF type:complete len:149 (-),score=56.13 GFYU01001130.1:34-480(-)
MSANHTPAPAEVQKLQLELEEAKARVRDLSAKVQEMKEKCGAGTPEYALSTSPGTKKLFENDSVIVWDLCLEPGQESEFHRHRYDNFFVVVTDGALDITYMDKTVKRFDMKSGEVHFDSLNGEDACHSATNPTDKPWRNIVVELKYGA